MIHVERRPESPPSLAHRSSTCADDVRQALDEDFSGKCYLCEGVTPSGFEVDHLRPKCDFRDLEFEWMNLFPAHGDCNKRRKTWPSAERELGLQRWPKGGMLDCTRDDVESRLSQCLTIDVNPNVTFCAIDPCDIAAKNTAAELAALHSRSKFHGRKICSAIEERYKTVSKQYDRLLQLLR